MNIMKKRTILLSIKNLADYKLLADLLQKEGHRVEKLTSANRMELLKKADAVLVDELTGPQISPFLDDIKESAGPFLPILALLSEKTPAEPWLSNCFDDIIRMPVGKAEFLTRMNSFLKLRAQSEQIIEHSEQKYRAIFESTGTATLIVDEDTTIVHANNECEEIFGYSPDQFIGKSWTDFVYKEDLALMLNRHRARRENPKSVERKYEVRIFNVDGDIKNIVLYVAMIPNTKQSVVSMLDISALKKAEEELKISEKRFRSLYDNVTLGLYRTTPDGTILLANPALIKMLGYGSFDELAERNLEKNGFEIATPRKQFIELIEKEGEVKGLESIWTRRDGLVFYVRESACAIRDSHGKTLYYDGTVEDITERRQAEEKIKHLNLVLRAIRTVNQLITKEKERDKVINGVCNNLIETRGYANAWIVLFDGSSKFVSAAEAGLGKDFLPLIELLRSGKNTVCGEKALKQSDPVITEFSEDECKDCPISCVNAGRGAMTIRLEHEGKIYGLMTVSIPRELIHDNEEIALFKEVSGDIAFALHSIKVDEKRRQAEIALQESEAKFRSLFSEMTEGVYLHEIIYSKKGKAIDYRIIEANPASEEILNIKPENAIGKLATELYGTKEAPYLDIYAKVAETGKGVAVEEYFPPMKKYLRILVYSPEKGKFATIFTDITERKKAEEQIKKDLEEKELLLRELYHRTKNNMQVISAMLRLRARTISDETVQTSFREIELKIRSMALVHQKLYESQDLSSLNLRSYFSDLIVLIRQSFLSEADKIQFHFDAPEDIPVLIDTAIPLGLVLNELLTNTVKHAFPAEEKGEIHVVLKQDAEKRLIIEVSDNGTGFPEDFNVEKDGHLGLQTVIALARDQLGGEVTFTSGDGFKCRIVIAKEQYYKRV